MFSLGALGDQNLTIIGRQRHTAYAQLPHSLDDKQTYSPNLAILIMVFSVVVYARLGLIVPMFPMFTLVTIFTYGLKTLV